MPDGSHPLHRPAEVDPQSSEVCLVDVDPTTDVWFQNRQTNTMPYMVNDPLSPWKECCVSFWQDAGPRADTIECLKPTREPASQPAIWVLGDSHASHIKNAVKQVVKVLNFAYASATVGDDCGFQTNPLLPPTEMRQKCQSARK